MMDPLSIVQGVIELGMAIKESIEKVVDNKENLADLEKEVTNTVDELTHLARGYGDTVATEEVETAVTALENLMEQLGTINSKCQSLTQSKLKKIPVYVQAWYKRDKIEGEIKKLKENRTHCVTQFQLLSQIRTEGNTVQTKVLAARIDNTAARTEGKTDQLITLVSAEHDFSRKTELREWFQAINMKEKQHTTYALRHDDTGKWVLEDIRFAKWKEEPGCLWIRGNSGTGKSVLSSIAIDHLVHYQPRQIANMQAAPTLGIAYFYFDFRDEKKQLVINMLRSIIVQLSEQSPEPYSVLDEQFKSCRGGSIFPPYDDLLVMLNTILGQFTGTYIVLDALDECSEHDDLVQFISTLRGWGKPVHLLVASQPRAIFVESAAFDKVSVVLLEPATTHADIFQFVNSKLKLDSKLKHVSKYAEDLTPKVVEKSNGMFRLAACLLQELLTRTSRINPKLNRILNILNELPNDLFGIYTRFLQPINEDDVVYAAALLRWLAFSAEPVTLCQLDEALAINFSEPDQWVFEPQNRGNVEDVCRLLEGLVTVGSVSKFDLVDQERPVTLAHSSVNDYIISEQFSTKYKHDLTEAPSHTFLTHSCVAYLLHFKHNPLNSDTLPQYLLARYAAKFWSYHLLRCHDQGVLQHSIMHLLENGSQQYTALNCVYNIDRPWGAPEWNQDAPWPLYLCSLIGYTEGVVVVLKHGTDVNATGGIYGSALQAAAWHSRADIVRVLLDHGADVNATGGNCGSALQGAAANGNVDIVHVLLDHGADVNATGGYYGSALQAAASSGRTGIVRVLLDHGADVNATGGDYGSALQAASVKGHEEIVCVLLDHSADVNATGGEYGSALQAAAVWGNVDIVRVLLDRGANVNTTGGSYGSALEAAAENGNVDIARVLLDRGANVNTTGGNYGSALQVAASRRNTGIVLLLIEQGADVNAPGGDYGSALQAAAAKGNVDIARVLLEHGADVNATGGDYGSALQAAAWYSRADIVRVLLDHGADVNATGGSYGSALQAAAARGNVDIVRILLDHGADVNTRGGIYGSALQAASVEGDEDMVRVLLDHGADVNAMGGNYGSALQGAAADGNVDIVRVLLDHGADVNATGGDYDSALQAAALYGRADIVRVLLDHGTDVNATGGNYGSALQAAVAHGNIDIVLLLIEQGADVNARGRKYGSALQAAAWHSRADIVRVLLDHGTDVNATGGNYGSALQAAAAHGNVDIVRVLLDHGADANATGGDYGSALAAAYAKGREEIAQLLREHGALTAELGKDSE
ncbi:ankyrin repeat-containing domain protein [Mycena vitilis]|nr:ankyrin repeat-containing domain protein [Mycena vitilis]